jgi:hypothetical protein
MIIADADKVLITGRDKVLIEAALHRFVLTATPSHFRSRVQLIHRQIGSAALSKPDPGGEYITASGMALLLGISTRQARNIAKSMNGAVQLPGGAWRIPKAAVLAEVERRARARTQELDRPR